MVSVSLSLGTWAGGKLLDWEVSGDFFIFFLGGGAPWWLGGGGLKKGGS